jgi:uncharacterized protein with HEPN domain
MQLEIQKFLYDILTSINSIEEFLGNRRDFKVYQSNKLLRRGIERELEIIGEAAGRTLKLDPDIPIDNIRKIIDLRNLVIHGYDKVDDEIIWSIISRHLPEFKRQVEELLAL